MDMVFASQFYFLGIPDDSHQVYDALHHQALKPLGTLCPIIPDLVNYFPGTSDAMYTVPNERSS